VLTALLLKSIERVRHDNGHGALRKKHVGHAGNRYDARNRSPQRYPVRGSATGFGTA
jgi:hypothetical protein